LAEAPTFESGELEALLASLSQAIEAGVTERFRHVTAMGSAPQAPAIPEDLPAARKRVSEELAFIGYVQGIYQATKVRLEQCVRIRGAFYAI
jgi:hypothetical protein